MGSRLDRITDWEGVADKANYTASNMAALCHVTRRQLERYWKRVFAQTPKDWLKRVRLKKAQALLQEGLSVKETAARLGFKRSSHLCREFKRDTGSSPNAFASRRLL